MERITAYDPRVYMLLLLSGALAGLLVTTSTGLLLCFLIALIWQLAAGRASDIFGYVLFYAICQGASWLALQWLSSAVDSVIALNLASMGVAARRAFPPMLFAMLLAKVPTGSMMGALYAMRMPKAVGIAVAIILRFFPTLAMEYRCIRNAQQFRGIGIGIWHSLRHPFRTASCILIPLIIRITMIADELSASATVRGIRFDNEVISYRPVRFTKKDGVLAGITVALFALILAAEAMGSGWIR